MLLALTFAYTVDADTPTIADGSTHLWILVLSRLGYSCTLPILALHPPCLQGALETLTGILECQGIWAPGSRARPVSASSSHVEDPGLPSVPCTC